MTIQTEAFWNGQQQLIEEFARWLKDDFTYADQRLEDFRDSTEVHQKTFTQLELLKDEHLRVKTEEDNEDMITRNQMHI